ncbi:MAG: O-antigen ligase family protein [Patescibacteria group bacterium]|nr:O-antigen ligase family protein [Patescibacteria group bacterium]
MDFSRFRMPFREDRLFSILVFLALVVPLAFTLGTYENFETVKYALWLVISGAALLALWPKQTAGEQIGGQWKVYKPFFLVLAGFWLLALVSAVFSLDPIYSIFGFYHRFTGSVAFYTLWIIFLVLLFKTLNCEKFEFLAKVLVFDAFAVAVVGFMQSLGIAYYEGLESGGFLRSPSLLGNPNFSTMFLAGTLPFALLLLWQSKKFSAKIYYGLAAFSIVLSILALSSRGALLGLAVGIITGFFLLARYVLPKKVLLVSILAAVICTALGLAFLKVTRPAALSNFSDVNVTLRLKVWKISVKGIAGQPWLGSGPGTFQIFFERLRPPYLAGSNGLFDDAHNLYIQLAATSGLPFLAAFLGLLGIAAWAGFSEFKKSRGLWPLAGLVSLVALAVAMGFNPVSIPNYLLLAVILAGLVLPKARGYELSFPIWVKIGIKILGGIFVLAGIAFMSGEIIFSMGYRQYFAGNYRKAARLNAWAFYLDPANSDIALYRIGSEIKSGKTGRGVVLEIENFKRMHPSAVYTYTQAANLYHLLAKQSHSLQDLQLAIDNLDQSLKMDPYASERYGNLGLFYYESGDYSRATAAIKQGLSQYDDFFPSWILLAKIYQLQDNRPAALQAIEQAYKLHPDILQVKFMWEQAQAQPDIKNVPIEVLVAEGKLE